MIRKDNLYIANAYRIDYPVAAAVKTAILNGTIKIEDGSVWALGTSADGETVWTPFSNDSTHGYITISSFKQGNLRGEGGRDTISDSMRLVCLVGPFRLETDQYKSTDAFTVGSFVKGAANADATHAGGILALWSSASDDASEIIGEVYQAPNADAGVLLGIIGR
jgi:hypothetical protein